MELKKGYKQTELGVIPEEWKLERLGEISKITMGQSPSSSNYNTKGIGLPLVQGNADIKDRKTIIRNYTSQITKKSKSGDIIMSVRAPVGEIATATFDSCIGRGVCAIKYPNKYLFQYLLFLEPSWSKHSTGSTFDSVNSDTVKSIHIPLPPLPEQKAIAQVLSDTDNLLQAITKKLAKKRAIKQGAMQRLLSPKDAWEVKKLGELINYTKGFAFKAKNYKNSGVRIIRVSDTTFDSINNNNAIYIDEHRRNEFKKWTLEKYDLIFSTVGSKPPMYDSLVGKVVLITEEHSGSLLNQNAVLVRAKNKTKHVQFFLLYQFRTKRYLNYIEEIFRGNATQASITLEDLFKFEILLPPTKQEQTRIATILSDMDAEIGQIEEQLNKYKLLKQGLMQQLLTGKIRLR